MGVIDSCLQVYLLLPEDASVVSPFSFVFSGNYCKSEKRTISALDSSQVDLLHVVMRAGDVLYIPPFWWHEERIVSQGHSLTTTFRIPLEDDERFHATLNNVSVLCEKAKKHGSDRLVSHMCSFLAYGLSRNQTSRTPSRWPLHAAMLLAVGILLGRLSTTIVKMPSFENA